MALFRRESRDLAVIDKRDPKAATQSLRYVTKDRAQPPDWNAHRAYQVAYYMEPIAYAAVKAIAETISGLPFLASTNPGDPDNANPNARLARMLGANPPGGPCPGLGASELWFAAVRDYLVTGRFGWEIETAPGGDAINAFWPLTAAALIPVPTQSGSQWFQRFEYGRPGDKRTLTADRVFYAWRPHGLDFRQPESALEAAGLAISVAVMQARFDYAFLKNDARPSTLVVTEQFADEDDKRAFEAQWNSTYGGPDNAGRIAVLETENGDPVNAVDVKILGVSAKDAQTQQRAEARQREIAIALGVPFSRLDASGRTFDNASQEDEIFWRQTLIPLVTRLQNAVNVQLAPRLGPEYGWFDLSGVAVLQPKPEPRPAPVAPGPEQLSAEAPTEVREVPPAPAATALAAAPIAEPPAPSLGIRWLGDWQERAPEPTAEEDVEARRTKIWNAHDAAVRNLERAWERAFKRLFARQAKSALARLEHKRARRAQSEVRALADEIFDPAFWVAETADEARILYERTADSAGGKIGDRFGIAFDLDAPYVQEFIDARANQLAGQVTDTTYQAIKDALAEGVGEGESIPDLADRLRHVFEVAESRATMIARTEVISAYNGAGTAVASAYGADVVAGQEWIATRDARTRDEHAERDGEVVPIGEPFSGGLAYPGDPSGAAADTINCRCTVAFLTPEEFAQRSGRSVPLPVARAVLALVREGPFDERAVRAALRLAA